MRPAGAVFLAAAAANIAGLVVTVALAHLLSSSAYGELGALNGLYLLIALPASAIALAVVRVMPRSAPGSLTKWRRRSVLWGSGAVAMALLASPAVSKLLVKPPEISVAAVMVGAIASVVCGIDRGVLQLEQRYVSLAKNIALEGSARLAGMVILVACGTGVPGAAIGIGVAEVATALDARRRASVLPESHAGEPKGRAPRLIGVDVLAALGAFVALAGLQNLDLVVVDRLAPDAGSYAAISAIAKALPLAALVVAGYVVGEAAALARAGRHSRRPLRAAAVVLGVPAVIGIVVAALFSHRLLAIVFPPSDLGASGDLVVLLAAMSLLSATIVLSMFMLARGECWVVVWLIAGACALWSVVESTGGHPLEATMVDLGVQAVVFGGVVAFWYRSDRRSRRAIQSSSPRGGSR